MLLVGNNITAGPSILVDKTLLPVTHILLAGNNITTGPSILSDKSLLPQNPECLWPCSETVCTRQENV